MSTTEPGEGRGAHRPPRTAGSSRAPRATPTPIPDATPGGIPDHVPDPPWAHPPGEAAPASPPDPEHAYAYPHPVVAPQGGPTGEGEPAPAPRAPQDVPAPSAAAAPVVPEPPPAAPVVPEDPAAQAHESVLVGALSGAGELVTPKTVALVLALVVLGVSWVAGGFRPVEAVTDDLPRVAAGRSTSAAPLRVTLAHARLLESDEAAGLPDRPGTHYLVVSGTLTMTDPQPLPVTDAALMLDPQVEGLVFAGGPARDTPTQHAPQILRPDGTGSLEVLQPDLPQDGVLVWEQQDGSGTDPELEVLLRSLTRRTSALSGQEQYLDPEPAARAALPVRDERTGRTP